MSQNTMPPVPPASRTPHAPADAGKADKDTSVKKGPPENLEQQARQGNINQNTHHQGYQQDR